MKKCIFLLIAMITNSLLHAQTVPTNEIWYTTSDGKIINFDTSVDFGVPIESNTYESGKGIIKFSGEVTKVADVAFRYTAIVSVNLPSSITSIGADAFYESHELLKFSCQANTPPTFVNSSAFGWVSTSSILLMVPEASVAQYQVSDTWKDFDVRSLPQIITTDTIQYNDLIYIVEDNEAKVVYNSSYANLTSIVVPESIYHNNTAYTVTQIGEDAFFECQMKSVTLPSTISKMGNFCFCGCEQLMEIIIPSKVTEIPVSCFAYCFAMTNVTIPSTLSIISKNAFNFNTQLHSIKLPSALQIIGDGSFAHTGLYSINIPSSVDTIGTYAFYSSQLSTISFEEGLVAIKDGAFINTRISQLTTPKSLTNIGERAFQSVNLTNILFSSGLKSIGGDAFYYDGSITEVICLATIPPTFDNESVFGYVDITKIPLYVPDSSLLAYKNAPIWKDFILKPLSEYMNPSHPANPGEYYILAKAIPKEGGVVQGSNYYQEGEIVTLTASANSRYYFSKWSDGNLDSIRTIQVGAHDSTFFASFERIIDDTVIVNDVQKTSSLYIGDSTHLIITTNGYLDIDEATTTETLTIYQNGNQSGQIFHIEDLTINSADIILELDTDLNKSTAKQWFAFAVPFEVDVNNGIKKEGSSLSAIPNVDFVIEEYDGYARSTAQQGWVSCQTPLRPGRFYMFYPNNETKLWRFTKTQSGDVKEQDSLTTAQYASTLSHHAGWNGLSNTLMTRANVDNENVRYATIYNNGTSTYSVIPLSELELYASQPFFVQVSQNDEIFTLSAISNNQSKIKQEVGTYGLTKIELTSIENNLAQKADYVYMSAADQQHDSYIIGKDLLKWQTYNTSVPQIWIDAYGLKLSAHDVYVEDSIIINLGVYAPQSAQYAIHIDRPLVSLMQGGKILPSIKDATGLTWLINLTQGESILYMVIYQNKPMSTDNIIVNENKNAKVLINGHLYIRHNDKVYDILGTTIK